MMSQITLNGIREKKLFLIFPECFLHCLVADGSLFSINLFLVQFLVVSIFIDFHSFVQFAIFNASCRFFNEAFFKAACAFVSA